MGRSESIAAFQDTLTMSLSPALEEATEQSSKSSRVYLENFHSDKVRKNVSGTVIVEENTAFAAAKKYKAEGKTAVLNFANPVTPGGGVQNGAVAQEECLCRSSNLYACPNIMAFEREFYGLSAEANKLRFSDPRPIAQSIGSVEMPSGKVLNGGTEFNPYREWQNKNKYSGKQFSILGDSISTLEGYNPKGYNLFYTGDACERSGVKNMKDTWWGKVIDYVGGELLVNNSWSGSRVTKLPQKDKLFPSGCSNERTGGLHIGSVMPDVIIVYLGTNDWAQGVKSGNFETSILGEEAEERFDFAYENMLHKLCDNYPDAEIWCCTLCETYISKRPDFKFPHKYAGTHIEEYNEIIRTVARENGCRLIDLYGYKTAYDSIDGSHPTANGMNTLATLIVRGMSDARGASFLDCEVEHDFITLEEYNGGTDRSAKSAGLLKRVLHYLNRTKKRERK